MGHRRRSLWAEKWSQPYGVRSDVAIQPSLRSAGSYSIYGDGANESTLRNFQEGYLTERWDMRLPVSRSLDQLYIFPR